MGLIQFWVSLSPLDGIQSPEILTGLFFLYIGPETILPLSSFIAAIVGFLLMFWRWVVGTCKRTIKYCSRLVRRICGKKIAGEDEGGSSLQVEKNEEVSNEKP